MPAYRTGFALPLDELRDEIDRLWTTLVTAPPLHGWGPRSEESVFPAVNLRETDEAFTLEAELPGISVNDVDISVSGDSLVLKGARRAVDMATESTAAGGADRPAEAAVGGKVVWLLRERGSGAFERRLKLPVAVDSLRVEARLVDGVLTVVCPKLAACQPRKVEVRGG
ncbi:MAG: Hsp20/alpha crystallin family protein [Planctomycetota bacterium]|nr:MAG: Hsp20/alpha crystallin family protein [Planctomycetota bacterium]